MLIIRLAAELQSLETFVMNDSRNQQDKRNLRQTVLLAAVATALVLLISYLAPVFIIGQYLAVVVLVLWVLLSACALGCWFIPGRLEEGRRLLQACGLGLGVISYGMFLLAIMGLWSDRWIWAFFLIVQAVSLPQWPGLLRYLRNAGCLQRMHSISLGQVAGLLFAAVCAFPLLALGFLPVMGFDALEYHLGVPWAYWQKGGMHFLPHLMYANFPMNAEMLFTLVWRIGGEMAIKPFHWGTGVLTAVGVYLWLKRVTGNPSATLGGLLFLTCSQFVSLASTAKIDLVVAFFAFFAFDAFWSWLHKPNRRDAILCGVFCGLTAGSKYSAVGIIVLPLGIAMFLSWLTAYLQNRNSKDEEGLTAVPFAHLVWFGLVVLILFSPWAIKNLIYQGNPVFPLGYSILGGETLDPEFNRFLEETTDATWREELAALGQFSAPSEKVLGFVRILTQGQPVLFLFLPLALAFLFVTQKRAKRLALLALLLGWLVWIALSRPLPRYLVPLYPAFFCLVMLAISRTKWRGIFPVASFVLILLLLFNLQNVGYLMGSVPQAIPYLTGQTTREELLRGLPHFAAIDFLNGRLSRKNSCVLFVAEARGFGCEVPYDLNTVYDRSILLQVIGDTNSPATWARRLRDEGYTHILYNPIELRRYRQTFEPSGWLEGRRIERVMAQLQSAGFLREVYSTPQTPAGSIRVYEVVEQGLNF